MIIEKEDILIESLKVGRVPFLVSICEKMERNWRESGRYGGKEEL